VASDDAPIDPSELEIEFEDDVYFSARVPEGHAVKVVTEADVNEGRYCINDVVLPLLGHQIQLPQNAVKDVLLELLEKDGLRLSTFGDPKLMSYRMSGAYRKLVANATDFTWSIRRYNDSTERLIPSDLDALERKTDDSKAEQTTQPCESSSDEGAKRALCVGFTLPSSTYATMLVRELTKEPTDTAHHMSLSVSEQQHETNTDVAVKRPHESSSDEPSKALKIEEEALDSVSIENEHETASKRARVM
jgi:tRNA(Glu) U13 pseudouridine synthase TruD